MKYLKQGFNMKLLVVPLVVRVSALVHRVIPFIGDLLALLELPRVSHFKVALMTKYDAVAKRVSSAILYWFSVVRLPAPSFAFGAIASNEFLPTSTAEPPP